MACGLETFDDKTIWASDCLDIMRRYSAPIWSGLDRRTADAVCVQRPSFSSTT